MPPKLTIIVWSEKQIREAFRLVIVQLSVILRYSDDTYFIKILITLYIQQKNVNEQ